MTATKPMLILGALLTSTSALAAPSPQTLIRNVMVFDGARSLGRHSVLLTGARIADVDYRGAVVPGMQVVDGTGKTLLPGLIDSHVHAFAGQDDALLFGVTTQLDMFSSPQSTQDIRTRMARGDNAAAADIFTSGILATVPKGHGTEYGFSIPTLTKPEEADAFVVARIAEGSDYIKIIDEPGTVARPLPTLDAATIQALVVAAHKRGKLAVVHVQNLASATIAMNAGADGLVHLFTDKDGGAAFAALAKAKHAFIVPTYTVFEVFKGRSGSATMLDKPALKGLLPKPAIANLQQSFGTDRAPALDTIEAANLAHLLKAGVPILAGTDSGNPGTWYGISLHRELDLLVKGGLTPTQALVAGTSAPAKAFRLADRGRIAKGLKADLLLVDGDPTADIARIHDIAEIWKDGQPVSAARAARRAEIAKGAVAKVLLPVELPADGRIGLFGTVDGKPVLKSPFGSGWMPSTDSIAGGTSTIAIAVTGAAPGGQPALVMTGEIKSTFVAPWAGISFSPGTQPFQPGNIAAAKGLRLQVRGEGKSFAVMGFSTAGGPLPSVTALPVTKDWHEVTVKFADLKGFEPANATLLLIGATQQAGPFTLEIADVRLVKD